MTKNEGQPETTQLYMIFIKGTPERIWSAITKAEDTRRYFHQTHLDAELRPGGKFHYRSTDASKLLVDAEVLELDPPKRLVTTWHVLYENEMAQEKPSRVTWEIDPQEGGYCKVTVTHDRLAEAPITAKHVSGAGWMGVLSGMKTLVETNAPMSNKAPANV